MKQAQLEVGKYYKSGDVYVKITAKKKGYILFTEAKPVAGDSCIRGDGRCPFSFIKNCALNQICSIWRHGENWDEVPSLIGLKYIGE